ncbi:MAG: hypothetical protein ACK55I_11825, partial [bacterium]
MNRTNTLSCTSPPKAAAAETAHRTQTVRAAAGGSAQGARRWCAKRATDLVLEKAKEEARRLALAALASNSKQPELPSLVPHDLHPARRRCTT